MNDENSAQLPSDNAAPAAAPPVSAPAGAGQSPVASDRAAEVSPGPAVNDKAAELAEARRLFVRNNCANFLTLLNVVFGCLSILLSINGRFRWAIAFIGLASVADRYDGVVARKLGTVSPLGVELDSLGDSISFGVAPALLIYMSLIRPLLPGLPKLFLTASVLFYITCGIFRLARYNVHGLNEGAFEGVPITLAGMILAFLMLLARELSVYIYGLLLLLFGVLMVSKFKLKKR